MASIRRAVASEKGRLKKLQQKEQKAVESGATPWVSSAVATATTSTAAAVSSSSSSSSKKSASNSNGAHTTSSKSTTSGTSSSSGGGGTVVSPVKKSLQELTKAAKAPVTAPPVSEAPKILIANPQKVEINGRVYAAKMLAIPGVSSGPAKKELSTASTTESGPVYPVVASREPVSSSEQYWDKAELAAVEANLKDNLTKPSSNSNGSNSTTSNGNTSNSSVVHLDESTESFMLKYLL